VFQLSIRLTYRGIPNRQSAADCWSSSWLHFYRSFAEIIWISWFL